MLSILAFFSEVGWLHRFGVAAFIGLGLLDQSVVPLPGSMDALLIYFTAVNRGHWWYYALWATLGTAIGSYFTYRIFRKGGKEALEKKIGKKRAEKAYAFFDRHGFMSVFIGAILPPPVPIVPFIASAGVMQYPLKWFFAAYVSGRILRYGLIAWITMKYGQHIFGFFSKYYKPAVISLIVLAVIGSIFGIWYYKKLRHRKQAEDANAQPQQAA